MRIELCSYVDGRWQPGAEEVADLNPARPTADIVATTRVADADLAAAAVEAARAAFETWRRTPAPARGAILQRAAALLEERAEAIGEDLAREEGKTLAEAIGETRRAVSVLRYYAGQTLEPIGEVYPSHSRSTFLFTRREPLGVVVAITPWNFPMALPAWKIAPALAYGNTVVWKPSELVPLTAVRLTEAFIDAGLPPGVLNLVLGRSSQVGPVLCAHDAVDAITFTGSNAVGRTLQEEAVRRGKKVQLELGGKNPAVVLADADLDHAAEQVARGAFLSAGQKCTATSRVIVEAAVLPAFTERLVDLARTWRLGDPLAPDTQVGPLVSAAQLERVAGYVEAGRDLGARVLAGGARTMEWGDGYFFQPTVFDGAAADAQIATEEIFGPVAVLLCAADFDEALALANATPFGLTASLFTRDLERALRFASDMRSGVVKINQETAGLEFQVPFGGMKESSSGSREQGKTAQEFFTQWKTIYMDAPARR